MITTFCHSWATTTKLKAHDAKKVFNVNGRTSMKATKKLKSEVNNKMTAVECCHTATSSVGSGNDMVSASATCCTAFCVTAGMCAESRADAGLALKLYNQQ